MSRPCTVWVVDDSSAVAASTALLLEAAGIHADAILNAQKVMANLDSFGQPDVMLLDLMMPHNGRTVLEKIVENPAWDFPVVVLTGLDEALPERLSGRVAAVFRKPADPLKLIGCVKELLARRECSDNLK